MFWDPLKEQLYDYVNGQEDLKKGIIRAIGNPHERFLDDRLRMMRAVRYSTRFNFPIEPATAQAILDHAPSLLPAVAMERVWQEFKKMSQFAHFDTGLVTLHKLDLLPTIFPQLKGIPAEEIQRRLIPLSSYPKQAPTIAELLELFPDHSLEELFNLCDYLKLSRDERDIAQFLHHAKAMLQMRDDLEKIEWAQFYANAHSSLSIQIASAHLSPEKRGHFLQTHAERFQSLEKAVRRIQTQSPVVRADQLIKQGISPGKKMGMLLKEAERISVNQSIEDPDAIIQFLKKSTLWNN